MEHFPEEKSFDFSENALIEAAIEKANPKKAHTLKKAMEEVLSERGLVERKADWVDAKTGKIIIDGSLFYELVSKASEKILARRTEDNPDYEADIENSMAAKDATRESTKPKYWWQKGQYE